MFFLGLLIGAGIYFIAYLIWYKTESLLWSVIVSAAIIIALSSTYPRLGGGSLAGFAVILAIGYFVGKRNEESERIEEEERIKKEQSYYKSHCWNCGNPIDGSWNEKCPDCNKYYICPKCGACKCDYGKLPPFIHYK